MKDDNKLKSFNVRLPYNVWKFLKVVAAEQERSMGDVIVECVDKYKKRMSNKLTSADTNI